jgi:hypothetical protein
MTELDVLLAVAGLTATLLVVAEMILLVPRGAIDVFDDVTDPRGEELSQTDAIDFTDPVTQPRIDSRAKSGPLRSAGSASWRCADWDYPCARRVGGFSDLRVVDSLQV